MLYSTVAAAIRRSIATLQMDCSGTAYQATPQGRCSHCANATGGKVGFELATYGIQFYVFCPANG